MPSTPAAAGRRARADAACADAVDVARTALLEVVPESAIGAHLGLRVEGDRLVTHCYECRLAGYRGWWWAVTVTRAARQQTVTVNEVVLLPGDEAVIAPDWVPYAERVQPGDMSPGDLLPVEADDPRLVPSYLAGDPDLEPLVDPGVARSVAEEVGFGRQDVLSMHGKDAAAERWYAGDHGPDTPLAKQAPGPCRTCGFMVRLSGPLGSLFGVCANAMANDDGRVVSYDHGCGAHSRARARRSSSQGLDSSPVIDTVTVDDVDPV